MKLNKTTVLDAKELTDKTYIIVNKLNEENQELEKMVLDGSTVASKAYVQALEEQNTKMVGIIQTIVKNISVLESKINQLIKVNNESEEKQSPKEDNTINEKLNIIISKLNDNILEL